MKSCLLQDLISEKVTSKVRKDREWILVTPVAVVICRLRLKLRLKLRAKLRVILERLQNVLENISNSEENTRKAVEIILSKQSFKCLIAESLMSKVNEVEKKVADLEQRIHERIK
jgi:hypothetical protein